MTIKKGELMKHVKELENLSKSQLHHTSQSSKQSEWAGSAHTDQNEWEDGIDDGGTDYNGVKKSLAGKIVKGTLTRAEAAIVSGADPRPFIASKISKGESLTPAESWVIKSGFTGEATTKSCEPGSSDSASSAPDTHAGNKEDDETEPDAKKSFQAVMGGSDVAKKGVEVSPFLAVLSQAFAEGLGGMQDQITKSIAALNSKLDAVEARLVGVDDNLGKSVDCQRASVETLVALGEAVAHQGEQEALTKSLPVGAPKSQVSHAAPAGPGPGGLDMNIQKSQIVEVMFDLVKSGELPGTEVIKYETTNKLSPSARDKVMARLGR